MKKILFFLLIFIFFESYSQQYIFGKVVSEQNTEIAGVEIFNISSDTKTVSDSNGNFMILANSNNDLRFLKPKFDRVSYHVTAQSFQKLLVIFMLKSPVEIKEVEIKQKLTGDLSKDLKSLTKNDKVEKLKKDIGIPAPPEKPREKPSDVKKDILLPILTGNLNIQAIYNVVSGKSKRQKRLYDYEDLQENITWVRKSIDDEYFIKLGIPKEKISNFIEFSFSVNPNSLKYVKAKNISGFLIEIERPASEYFERAKS